MTHLFYLIALCGGIVGLVLIDRRLKLALFNKPGRALRSIAITTGGFIIWDLLGIGLDIFSHGDSPYSIPFVIAPEFPLEEIVFLFLLSYTSILLLTGVKRWRRI